ARHAADRRSRLTCVEAGLLLVACAIALEPPRPDPDALLRALEAKKPPARELVLAGGGLATVRVEIELARDKTTRVQAAATKLGRKQQATIVAGLTQLLQELPRAGSAQLLVREYSLGEPRPMPVRAWIDVLRLGGAPDLRAWPDVLDLGDGCVIAPGTQAF